jgi:hypothetical protein
LVSPSINTAIATAGIQLVASAGSVSGSPTPTLSYRWLRSTSVNGTYSAINGATSLTYTPVTSDGGYFLKFERTATNGVSPDLISLTSATNATIVSPVVLTNPSFASGSAMVGSTLQLNAGTVSGYPTPTGTMTLETSSNGTTGWTTVSGVTTSYTIVSGDLNNYYRIRVSWTNSAGTVVINSANLGPVQAASTGIGFVARPYFFQVDAERLQALVSSNVTEWGGTSSNNVGQPIGYNTLMAATLANRASNDDIPTWQLAIGGWLANNATMRQRARTETLAIVRAKPSGSPLSGDEYQHIEDIIMNVALVVDCCYNEFSAGERAECATYVNGAMTYAEQQNDSFWPYDSVHNNYWQNRFLASAIAGLSGEGWMSQAANWRSNTVQMANLILSTTGGYNLPFWQGPQISEGSYYSTYTVNMMWGMRQYDSVMGTNWINSISFTANQMLEMYLFLLRPHLNRFFSVGSEAADASASWHGQKWQLIYAMMFMTNDINNTNVRLAKAIMANTAVTGSGNFWARSDKAFKMLYFYAGNVTASALTAKSERRMVLPVPGGGLTMLRSTDGWNVASANPRRAMVIFSHKTDWTSSLSPGWSHANPDSPGFQWGQNNSFAVVDCEYDGNSGVRMEAGNSDGGLFSNIVIINGQGSADSANSPIPYFNEDNTGVAVPHYYVAINAQPYWTNTSIYRRQYVVLDDLQVVVIHDRIVGTGSKTWRLHLDGSTSVTSGTATCTTTDSSYTLRVRDLYSTSGGAMSASNLNGTQGSAITRNIYRLLQTDAATDFRSLKVMDVGNRVSTATLVSGTGYLQANLTINGIDRTVRFYDDTTHAEVN